MVTWDPQAVPDLSMLCTEHTGEGLGRGRSAQPAQGLPWLRFQVGTGDLGGSGGFLSGPPDKDEHGRACAALLEGGSRVVGALWGRRHLF